MAHAACGNREDALDIVQDAMCRFVDKYATHAVDEWKPLFYRVLRNRIVDHHRKKAVRNRWNGFLGRVDTTERGCVDPFQEVCDSSAPTPEHASQVQDAFARLHQALRELPEKQRQVFMLRAWEELSTRETALAMSCSEGSVKTHYSRAVTALRKRLGDHWP